MKLHHLASVALLALAVPVWAATPASGELSAESVELTWEGSGPYVFTNLTPQLGAGGQPPICEEVQPVGCDIFTLTVNFSDEFRKDAKNAKEVVTVGITFPQDPGGQVDYDLYIYDSSGTEVGQSASGAPQTSETVTFPLKALKNGDYSVDVIVYTPLGTNYSGLALIGRAPKSGESGESGESGDVEAKDGDGLLLGAFGFPALFALFGLLFLRNSKELS